MFLRTKLNDAFSKVWPTSPKWHSRRLEPMAYHPQPGEMNHYNDAVFLGWSGSVAICGQRRRFDRRLSRHLHRRAAGNLWWRLRASNLDFLNPSRHRASLSNFQSGGKLLSFWVSSDKRRSRLSISKSIAFGSPAATFVISDVASIDDRIEKKVEKKSRTRNMRAFFLTDFFVPFVRNRRRLLLCWLWKGRKNSRHFFPLFRIDRPYQMEEKNQLRRPSNLVIPITLNGKGIYVPVSFILYGERVFLYMYVGIRPQNFCEQSLEVSG